MTQGAPLVRFGRRSLRAPASSETKSSALAMAPTPRQPPSLVGFPSRGLKVNEK
jgi:hypothetical protein